MSKYTTTLAVKNLLGEECTADTNLEPFLSTANALVDQLVKCAKGKGINLEASLLERIAANLAAHFFTNMEPVYKSRTTQDASATWLHGGGPNLNSSPFGQTARMLDISGCLAQFENGTQVIQLKWLGKVPRGAV